MKKLTIELLQKNVKSLASAERYVFHVDTLNFYKDLYGEEEDALLWEDVEEKVYSTVEEAFSAFQKAKENLPSNARGLRIWYGIINEGDEDWEYGFYEAYTIEAPSWIAPHHLSVEEERSVLTSLIDENPAWVSMPSRSILNLTQHVATPQQIADGVFEPTDKIAVQKLLTFDEIPNHQQMLERACTLANICKIEGAQYAMIGGAPYFMPILQQVLIGENIIPMYSFSQRKAVDVQRPDGSVVKQTLFQHAGFVIAEKGQ